MITNLRIKKKNFVVGPEYFALAITAVVSAVTGGTWTANKVLERQQEPIQQAFKYTDSQKGA